MAELTFWQENLANELKRLRGVADLTQQQVRREIGWSIGKLNAVENANVALSNEDLGKLLDLYGVAGRQRKSLEGQNQPQRGGWFDFYEGQLPDDYVQFIRLEDRASDISTFDTGAVLHGLLQTEEYAREIITVSSMGLLSPREIERRVEVRMTRQNVLRRDEPLRLSPVIFEPVLDCPVGGDEVMRAQLEHLLTLADLPNVSIQILPLSVGAHPGMFESFSILSFPEGHVPDVTYVDGLAENRYFVGDRQEAYSLAMNRLRALALDVASSRQAIASRTT